MCGELPKIIYCCKKGRQQFLASVSGKVVWIEDITDSRIIYFADKRSAELFAAIDHIIPGKSGREIAII